MQKKREKTLNNSCTTALHHKNNRGPSLVALVFWATFFTLFFLAFAFPIAAFAFVAWACPAATVFSSFLMQSEQRTAPGIFRNLLGSPWMLPARGIWTNNCPRDDEGWQVAQVRLQRFLFGLVTLAFAKKVLTVKIVFRNHQKPADHETRALLGQSFSVYFAPSRRLKPKCKKPLTWTFWTFKKQTKQLLALLNPRTCSHTTPPRSTCLVTLAYLCSSEHTTQQQQQVFSWPRHLLKVCKHPRHMPDTHNQPITLAYSRQFYNVLTTSAYFLLLSSQQPLGQSCAQNKAKLILQEQYAAHQMHKMIDLHEIGKIGKY